MNVKVITDSTCDLPPELADRLNVHVVPLTVHFGEQEFRDGIDLDVDPFYQMLEEGGIHPSTSQPSVGAFIEAYEQFIGEDCEIISIHISSKVSGTYNSACQARKELGDPDNIHIIDSRHAAMSLGLMVINAVEKLSAGLSCQQIEEELNDSREQFQLFGLLDTLEYLKRGGRIGKASAFVGSLLRIKPILSFAEGELHPVARVRSLDKGLDKLVDMVKDCGELKSLAVMYSTGSEIADALHVRLEQFLPKEKIIQSRLGPVLGVHVGPNCIAVALQMA